jgi:Dolichyl-phosphate-mannose-protein mannosyltransferase
MMPGLQELIHKFEEGEGVNWIKGAFWALLLVVIAGLWHWREAKNFSAIEAMDAAQVGHNLAQGRGFSTQFIRPLSIALVERVRGEGVSVVKDGHPDLANPPVYPALLAGLMKVLPFRWDTPGSTFWRYQPEVLIGIFNQLLFFAAILLVYRLGCQWFDKPVGAMAAFLFAGTELFWEFTTSGLSTMLLIVLFLALAAILGALEREGREPTRTAAWGFARATAVGVLLAAMALTRYSMLALALPAVLFLGIFGGTRKTALAVTAGLVLVVLTGPWLVRNYALCGHLFGIAGTAIHQNTTDLPGERLERMMPKKIELELNKLEFAQYPRKLVVNGSDVLQRDLPQVAGSWIAGLFLVGLLMPFRNPMLSRVRYFVVASAVLLGVCQALGRTYLSARDPLLTSENLLVIIAPMVFVFGAALFFTLLDQIEFPFPAFRPATVFLFALILISPMILRLLPPRSYPYVYPPTAQDPYLPPVVREIARWMQPDEMMMTDMPWAVAWYGDRPAVWVTLDYGLGRSSDFYRINDYQKAIKALYLTPRTTDLRFLTEMLKSPEGAWGRFVLDSVLRTNVPSGFPLKKAPPGLFPAQLFLSDQTRWK